MLDRIRELGIPPAWKDVWICPYPRGHLQATGIDAAGRKQYLYHDALARPARRQKFDDMVASRARCRSCASASTSRPRRATSSTRDARAGLRGAPARPRLLPHRLRGVHGRRTRPTGSRRCARRTCASSGDDEMVFDYPAKSGQRRVQAVVDPRGGRDRGRAQAPPRRGRRAARLPGGPALARRALGRHQRLHQGRDGRRLLGQGLPDLERDGAGGGRARRLRRGRGHATGRKRAVTRAIKEVAHYLGNTPAVCRASYIDPRVFDAYQGGVDHRPAAQEAAGCSPATADPPPRGRGGRARPDHEREDSRGLEKIAA